MVTEKQGEKALIRLEKYGHSQTTVDTINGYVRLLKGKVINRQAHINTLRQDLNRAQDQTRRKDEQVKDLKTTLSNLKIAMANNQYLTVREILNV